MAQLKYIQTKFHLSTLHKLFTLLTLCSGKSYANQTWQRIKGQSFPLVYKVNCFPIPVHLVMMQVERFHLVSNVSII